MNARERSGGDQPVKWAAFVGLGLIVLLSRLPFLSAGYGADPDAWRVLAAARHLAETGEYVSSRSPGYPLPEYVAAWLVRFVGDSPFILNLPVALMSAVASVLAAVLARPWGQARAILVGAMLAFTPSVYIASVGDMDYMWGLSFFLASALLTRAGWLNWGSFMLGLAAASRPTYALGFLPIGLLALAFQPRRLETTQAWQRLVRIALVSGLTAVVFYLPQVFRLGLTWVRFEDHPFQWTPVFYNATVGLFGLWGALGVLSCLAVFLLRKGWRLAGTAEQQATACFAWMTVAIYGALFFRLADEAAYLIPAGMGLYVLLAGRLPFWGVAALLICLAASCFVGSLGKGDDGGMRFKWQGMVLKDQATQRTRACVAGQVQQLLTAGGPMTHVIAGHLKPQIAIALGEPLSSRVLYRVHRGVHAGELIETEGLPVPPGARLLVLDIAAPEQDELLATREVPAELTAIGPLCR